MFSEQKLLCYSRGWVKQYAESKNSEGKEIKIGFSVFFLIFYHQTKYGTPYIRDFRGVFGGKICNVWRRQDGAGYFVSSKGIFVHKYPFILRYSDWLVLEIITQWTGKTILY